MGIDPIIEAADSEQQAQDTDLLKKIASISQAQSEIMLDRHKYIVGQNLKKALSPHNLKIQDNVRTQRKQCKTSTNVGKVESIGSGLINVRTRKKIFSAHPRFVHKCADSGDNTPLKYDFREDSEGDFIVQTNDEDLVLLTPSIEREFIANKDGVRANQKELNGLTEKGVVEHTQANEIPRGAQILPLIWAYNIRDSGKFRARCRVRGDLEWSDALKSDCHIVRRSPDRRLISEALSDSSSAHLVGFEMAYMQGNPFERRLCGMIQDPIDKTKTKQYVRTSRPLYGLKDAAYQRHTSLTA